MQGGVASLRRFLVSPVEKRRRRKTQIEHDSHDYFQTSELRSFRKHAWITLLHEARTARSSCAVTKYSRSIDSCTCLHSWRGSSNWVVSAGKKTFHIRWKPLTSKANHAILTFQMIDVVYADIRMVTLFPSQW